MTFALILGWVLFGLTLSVLICFIIGMVVFFKRMKMSKSTVDMLTLLTKKVNSIKEDK